MSQAQAFPSRPASPFPIPLSPTERSALHRAALSRGDLTPVHQVIARSLESLQLVRLVPPTVHDRATRLAKGETWVVITEHGRTIDGMLIERARRVST